MLISPCAIPAFTTTNPRMASLLACMGCEAGKEKGRRSSLTGAKRLSNMSVSYSDLRAQVKPHGDSHAQF